MTHEHDALLKSDETPSPEAAETWELPPLSLRAIMLLEKIDSPFSRPAEPLLDDKGVIQLDPETNRPLFRESNEIPSMTQIVQAYYVLKNQADPTLSIILDDPHKFENAVLELAGRITPEKISALSEGISKAMTAVNDAAKEQGLPEDTGPKGEAGPTLS